MFRCWGIVVLVCFATLYAQQTDTLRFFFEIGDYKTAINPAYRKHLESRLNDINLDSIWAIGYADFLSGTNYNLMLSEKRAGFALKIVDEIRQEKKSITIRKFYFGEKFSVPNGKKEGDAWWRRAELILFYGNQYANINAAKDSMIKKNPVPIHAPADSKNTRIKRKSKMKCDFCEEKFLEDISKANAGDTVRLWGIEFRPGRHVFMPDAIYILNALLEVMRKYPEMKIEIQGHICCQLGENDGLDMDTGEMNLSLNRALAVRDWLIKKGIDANRMKCVGFGGRYPKVYPETNEEDQQRNRRVDLLILEK
ncbi:MAG: OmpA family protein [Bacteroidia bacterium]|nr:OmpA family protein [Bacteroidia bacterium]